MTTHHLPGLVLTDHTFSVPLDHDRPGGEQIEVYAREATAPGRGSEHLPWLLYLQGGPGCAAPRPLGRTSGHEPGGWIGRAVQDYRVLLLDQRGTGRSTPANRQTLPLRGTPRQQAEYLTHFRADAIVRDAELIRRQLTGGEPWSVLGQSFGGFCATTYLSLASEGLREVLLTGGLPGLNADADAVYRAAYPRMQRKSAAHYARYPQDVEAARRIAAHLREHETVLPNGALLTAEAFQSLGILLGTAHGSARLHYLLEDAFTRTARGSELSDPFQEQVQAALSYTARPLYALLHEAIYALDGHPTAWAAERVRAEFPQFDAGMALAETDAPLLFTGETVYPWHFRTDPALRPLRETARLLAEHEGWTPLYDQEALTSNQVPVAAAVYHDDLYVDTDQSLRTADVIAGLRTWVTDDHEHDGLSVDGAVVLDRLLGMVRDTR